MAQDDGKASKAQDDFTYNSEELHPENDPTPTCSEISHAELMATTWTPDPQLIPGFLEGFLVALFSPPGVGKTWLLQQAAYHVSGMTRLGHFEEPLEPVRSLLVLLEDSEHLTQSRADSMQVSDKGPVRYWIGGLGEVNRNKLETELIMAEAEGRPIGFVGIDHFSLFVDPRLSKDRADEHEEKQWSKLAALAKRYNVTILVLGHTNKAGIYAGSTKMLGSLGSAFGIEKGTEGDAVLKCIKMRYSEHEDYPMERGPRGAWQIGGVSIAEATRRGVPRTIIEILRKEGPQSEADLCQHGQLADIKRGTLRKALERLVKKDFVVERLGAKYVYMPTNGDIRAAVTIAEKPLPVCKQCGLQVHPAGDDGRGFHNASDCYTKYQERTLPQQEEPREVTSIEEPETGGDEVADSEAVEYREKEMPWGWKVMETSIQGCKGHPVPWYPTNRRAGEPLSLLVSKSNRTGHTEVGVSCEHRWTLEGWQMRHVGGKQHFVVPEGAEKTLVGLDRNGSFFSSLSSVKVAANLLLHTGPLEAYDKVYAGLYLVKVPEWTEDDVPHPMGRAGVFPGATKLITTPTMELLSKLAESGRMEKTEILDSWTGRVNSNLFRSVYEEARQIREATYVDDPEEYQKKKGQLSRAVRSLYPTQTYSRFYRPDWHLAIRAESSKRLWHKAQQAVRQEGAQLVFLGNTDLAIFNTEDGQAPANYTVGTAFGEVKFAAEDKWGE